MAEYDNDMVRMGIIHFKSGELSAARNYFERALAVADDQGTRFLTNLYLSRIEADPKIKRYYLEEALALDPGHAEARRELAILDGKIKPEQIVNPDALPAQSTNTKAVQADRFTCPKCGARMMFDGDGHTLICEYCTRNQLLGEQVVDQEQDFIVAMATGKGHRKPVAMQTFHCQGCGADFLLPPTAKSAVCAYCASVHVIKGDARELVEPDAIVPMAFKQRDAIRYLVEWAKKNKIEPQGKVQPPRAVYLPVWTFDITGSIPWKGYVYENKKWVPVSGTQPAFFNDIPVPAVSHHAGLVERLLPEFDLSGSPAYDPRYLAGWPAEVYERAMSDASLDARQKAVQRVKKIIHSKRDQLNELSYSAAGISVISFKLIFIPIWITEYPLEGKQYTVLINGANGAVHGETPGRGILDWLGGFFGK